MINIILDYVGQAQQSMREYKQQADEAINSLSDELFFREYRSAVDSVALLMQHLAGNMLSLWADFPATDKSEWRDHDPEFITRSKDRVEIMRKWEEGWESFFRVLDAATPELLAMPILFRKRTLMLFEAIYRQSLHYSYHTGQIALLAKLFRDGVDDFPVPVEETEVAAY